MLFIFSPYSAPEIRTPVYPVVVPDLLELLPVVLGPQKRRLDVDDRFPVVSFSVPARGEGGRGRDRQPAGIVGFSSVD